MFYPAFDSCTTRSESDKPPEEELKLLQVCFASMQHEILVYEYVGPTCCVGATEGGHLPFPDSMPFSRFFKLKYRRLLAHGNEVLCKELCLVTPPPPFP